MVQLFGTVIEMLKLTLRPESMLSEMELNNIAVELLIENANEIFKI